MTVSTVRSDSTVSNGLTITGGSGTAHGVLSDDSDGSYVSWTTAGNRSAYLGFGNTPAPAAGSVITRIGIRARSKGLGLIYGSVDGALVDGAQSFPTVVVTWPTITTHTLGIFAASASASLTTDPLATLTLDSGSLGSDIFVYELYIDVYHAVTPVTDVISPSGTLTTTNLPTVTWNNTTLDDEGGAQAFYEVKIFDDAHYPASPAAATAATDYTSTSGQVSGSDTSWTGTTRLPNDTYRAYVRVGQDPRGDGTPHWSAWDYLEFTENVPNPASPTVTATASDANGRIALALAAGGGGAADTTWIEVQRSIDGGTTYEEVRTTLGDGRAVASTIQDYEAPNGVTCTYRARAIHYFSAGFESVSAWVTDTEAWTSTSYWLKHPTLPALNTKFTLVTPASGGVRREARQLVVQPLGATQAVVVSDTRGPATGVLRLINLTDEEQDALDALLETADPLLLQMVPGDHEDDRWLAVSEHTRTRAVDMSSIEEAYEDLPWIEVGRPEGDLE